MQMSKMGKKIFYKGLYSLAGNSLVPIFPPEPESQLHGSTNLGCKFQKKKKVLNTLRKWKREREGKGEGEGEGEGTKNHLNELRYTQQKIHLQIYQDLGKERSERRSQRSKSGHLLKCTGWENWARDSPKPAL